MKALVTGATGFIGSHLAKMLVKDKHNVRCLVRKTSDLRKLKELKNVELFYGDIADKRTLKGVNKDIDVVFNTAGLLGKWNSTDQDLAPVNVWGVKNLIEEFKNSKIKKFVHLSAGGVTGPVKEGLADETYLCHPSTAYERTKYEGEKLALELGEKYHLPMIVVRPTFTYGPGDPHKFSLFKLVKKGFFVFVSDGESTLHPVYIGDLIGGVLLASEKGKTGGVYIIGGEKPISKKEFIFTIAESMGVSLRYIFIPYWLADILASGMGMVARLFHIEPILSKSRVSMMGNNWGCDISKARRELGYDPKVNLEEAIKRTVRWYKEHNWL